VNSLSLPLVQKTPVRSGHGITDSTYIKELSKKTFRGIEGRVLSGRHHGGHIFGYKSVPIEDPTRRDQYGRPMITGAQLRVDPEQANIVRRVFSLYASGLSIKSVTKQLNREGVQSPRPRPGREHSWAPSSVRNILQNRRYVGLVTYGHTRKLRNPVSGKRIYRRRPESEWTKVECAEQRIVSDELWTKVRARLAFVLRAYGDAEKKAGLLRSRLADSPYVFSGILKCAVCGGSFSIGAGAGGRRK
jgi:site-specific DNA recombinase